MSANVYVIFKNEKPVIAVVGDLRDAMAEAGGENWAPVAEGWLGDPRHWEHPGGLAIRQVWPLAGRAGRLPVDVYAVPELPGTRAADEAPIADWIDGEAQKVLGRRWAAFAGWNRREADRMLYGGPPQAIVADAVRSAPKQMTRDDLAEAMRRVTALRTTSMKPIRVDRLETFRRFIEATGIPIAPAPDIDPLAASFMGVPVITDPRLPAGVVVIGTRLMIVLPDGKVIVVDENHFQDYPPDARAVVREWIARNRFQAPTSPPG